MKEVLSQYDDDDGNGDGDDDDNVADDSFYWRMKVV
jgi:hypothetical protein